MHAIRPPPPSYSPPSIPPDRELRELAEKVHRQFAKGGDITPVDAARMAALVLDGAPLHPRVGVSVVARYRGGFAGRKHPVHGKWEVPGGRVEPGENPRFSAFREFVEETGLVPIGLREVYSGEHEGPAGSYLARVFTASVEGQHGTGSTEDGSPVIGAAWADLTGPEGLYAETLRAAFPGGEPPAR